MKIYLLSDRFDRTAPRLAINSEDEPLWRLAVRGHPTPVLTCRQYSGGRHWKDFLWTSSSGIPIVSERVRDLLQKDRISGWAIYDVAIVDGADRRIPGYYGLAVTGRCGGRIGYDRRESALIHKPSAQGGSMPYFRGLHYDAGTWDGADLFMDQEGAGWMLVTEKVAETFKRAKVSNCELTDIDVLERPAIESEVIKGV